MMLRFVFQMVGHWANTAALGEAENGKGPFLYKGLQPLISRGEAA